MSFFDKRVKQCAKNKDKLGLRNINAKKKPRKIGASMVVGNDLLSHINCSIIGAGGLNFSVRNGKR